MLVAMIHYIPHQMHQELPERLVKLCKFANEIQQDIFHSPRYQSHYPSFYACL